MYKRQGLSDIAPNGKVKILKFYEDVFPAGDIKRMRGENGGEYIARRFKALLVKNSIKHELTSPNSPHQNGTAEQSWRTVFEMARSLIIESKLLKNLWAYAVMTATHIKNRCYSQRIHNTLCGLITGLKPNVAKLHVFGTVCYAYTHRVVVIILGRTKLLNYY